MRKTAKINSRNRSRYGNNWYGKNGVRRKFVESLLKKQDYKCKNCMAIFIDLQPTLDHIKPLAEGGRNEIDNMQLLCEDCHVKKEKEHNRKWGILGSLNQKRPEGLSK